MTFVGSCTPPTGVHSTLRLTSWQYAAPPRSFHGGTVGSHGDRAASCSSAVHAHGLSLKAERSAHSAEMAVPPGQMLPTAQTVSA